MADVNGKVEALRQADIAGDHNVLNGAKLALEAAYRGVVALVYHAAVDKRCILAVAQTL